ncbi:MAG: hypothetical protein D6706_06900 [Chloroflexi bacterium]|nr:MAG: hypothetical protein D6706_06900 [Chloroflexota bacterium]
MNRRLPGSFEHSYQNAPSLEDVLAATQVDRRKTAVYNLTAPGEHPIYLHTTTGTLRCHVRVRPHHNPNAPLILYHHGFNETPYTNSWRRIFSPRHLFAAHTVCIQAPFHNNWRDPLLKGFASLQNVYQIFAGSLRIMELVQQQFEAQGTPWTIVAGASWGGITSMLYAGILGNTRAVVPMLSSPNLAQVLWDIADLFNRPVPISHSHLSKLLDFTPYYRRVPPHRVFPLLGECDLFFRWEHHAPIFEPRPITTINGSHITSFLYAHQLRQHLLSVLEQVQSWPENGRY